jgi:general secretion pathway protein J
MSRQLMKKNTCVFQQPNFTGLFKNVQMQGAQKKASRDVYFNTLSGEFYSATRQMSVFQQSRGFTLVEILVAIFILSLVMATVYVSYSGTLKTTHQLEEDGTIYKMARASMGRMINDLSSLQAYSDSSGSSGSFDLHAGIKKIGSREFHSLSFWSASHLAFSENEGEERPAAISYYVQEDNERKSFSLLRADVSGSKPDSTKNTEGGFIICQNIDSFRLTFYDASGGETDSWDSSATGTDQTGSAPAVIKIELSLVNPSDPEKPYKFMTNVFLPVKK